MDFIAALLFELCIEVFYVLVSSCLGPVRVKTGDRSLLLTSLGSAFVGLLLGGISLLLVSPFHFDQHGFCALVSILTLAPTAFILRLVGRFFEKRSRPAVLASFPQALIFALAFSLLRFLYAHA